MTGPVLPIRPGGIGEAVHLVPAIRTLKQLHADCQINVLAERRNAGVFEPCPDGRMVYRYDQTGDLAGRFAQIMVSVYLQYFS